MGLLQKYLQGIISNERNELGYKQRVPYQKMELFWIIISFQYLDSVSYPYEV